MLYNGATCICLRILASIPILSFSPWNPELAYSAKIFIHRIRVTSVLLVDMRNQLAHSPISHSAPVFAVKTSPVFAALVRQAWMHIYITKEIIL